MKTFAKRAVPTAAMRYADFKAELDSVVEYVVECRI